MNITNAFQILLFISNCRIDLYRIVGRRIRTTPHCNKIQKYWLEKKSDNINLSHDKGGY